MVARISDRSGRPPDGKVAKRRSRTALLAFVAAALEQRPDGVFLEELEIALDRKSVEKVANPRRARGPGWKLATAREIPVAGVAAGRLFHDWQLVDEAKLGLNTMLVRVRITRAHTSEAIAAQRAALAHLRRLDGVRQILAAKHGGPVTGVLVVRPDDISRVHAHLEELADPWDLEDIAEEDFEPALRTWRSLAVRQARDDGLLR